MRNAPVFRALADETRLHMMSMLSTQLRTAGALGQDVGREASGGVGGVR